MQARLAAFLPRDLDVSPAHAMPPSGTECLHGRLFHRKSSGVTFVSVLVALAVGDFTRREQSVDKRRAVPPDRGLHPVDFRDIQSHAYDHLGIPLRGGIIPDELDNLGGPGLYSERSRNGGRTFPSVERPLEWPGRNGCIPNGE